MIDSLLEDVKRMDKYQFFYQVLSFAMIVSSALMIWKGLMVATGSESPIVVVLWFDGAGISKRRSIIPNKS